MSVASNQNDQPAGRDSSRSILASTAVRSGLAALVLILVVGLILQRMRPPAMHGVVLQSPERAADFTLDGSAGTPLSLSDFRGKFVLLYFGYTYCPDVCPTTLQDLAVTVDALGEKADDLQVVMVSVDPDRDTPEYLGEYLEHFDPGFLGATGTLDELEAVASRYGVFFDKAEGSAATGYLVDHTSSVTLIDDDGYVREVFPYGVTGEDMAADIAYWMR
jgi:protein SCO1/2